MQFNAILKVATLFILISANSGCREIYAPPATTKNYNYLVVSGFFTSGLLDSTTISLSRTKIISGNSAVVPELNAKVWVEDEEATKYTLKDYGNGKYSLPPANFDLSKKYRLHIKTYLNQDYTSEYVPILSSPALDHLAWKEAENNIEIFLNTHDSENKTRYYLWTYDETWEYTSFDYSQFVIKDGKVVPRASSAELYYCWRTLSSKDIYIHTTQALREDIIQDYTLVRIPDNDIKFYYEYSMLIKQHAISAEAYAYWQSIKRNTESLGTLFDPIPSQQTGNLHATNDSTEPVIGYFSASAPSQKRISFNRQQLKDPQIHYTPTGYENCTKSITLLSDIRNTSRLLIQPVYDTTSQQLIGYITSPESCIDCRAVGGTTTRPDFWK